MPYIPADRVVGLDAAGGDLLWGHESIPTPITHVDVESAVPAKGQPAAAS